MTSSQLFVALALASLILSVPAVAQEKKIKKEELPAVVQKTADEQSKGATVRGYSTEMEDGKTIYEVQLTVNGKSRDVSIDSSGGVIEVEDQIDFASLPDAVQAGLKKKAGAGRILRVEAMTKKDRLVAYEAVVDTAGKKHEIQVGPDGKPLAHEE
jgi:hypothetical protein